MEQSPDLAGQNPAPLLTELLAQLPKMVEEPNRGFLAMVEQGEDGGIGYGRDTFEDMDLYEEDPNPAEAAARLWLTLLGS